MVGVVAFPNGNAVAVGGRTYFTDSTLCCVRLAGVIARFHAGEWSTVTVPDAILSSIAMSSPEEGWAGVDQNALLAPAPIGKVTAQGPVGTLLHYVGGQWIQVKLENHQQPTVVSALAMVSTTEGWGGGSISGSPAIWHLQDGTWTETPDPTSDEYISNFSMLSPTEGWAVGGEHSCDGQGCSESGVILHYAAGRWTLDQG
jgi:hypothetical protein